MIAPEGPPSAERIEPGRPLPEAARLFAWRLRLWDDSLIRPRLLALIRGAPFAAGGWFFLDGSGRSLACCESLPETPGAHLFNVYVAPAERRRGLAAASCAACLDGLRRSSPGSGASRLLAGGSPRAIPALARAARMIGADAFPEPNRILPGAAFLAVRIPSTQGTPTVPLRRTE